MTEGSRRYRYPWSELRGDDIRAGFGVALTGLPLAATWGELYAGLILGALMAIFALFGLRTALRQASAYEVGDDGITRIGWARNGWSILGAGRVSLPWRDVERVKLAFYSTRRDRSKGWMHLKISGGSHRLGIDSNFFLPLTGIFQYLKSLIHPFQVMFCHSEARSISNDAL